jgi:RND family efflux transporter MFP subunit
MTLSRTTLLIGLGIVLVAGAAVWMQTRKPASAPQAPAATSITQHIEIARSDITVMAPQRLQQGLPVSGTLRAVQSAVVKARVAGELLDLQVREGDSVQAGQVLARIDPTEFQRRLRQAEEQAEAARTQIDIAQRQFDNNRALVDQGFISKTALDTSLATLQSAQATFRAAQAGADVARKSLEDSVLKAPFTGVVSARLAQPGERMAIDARVLELVNLSSLELEATLSAADSVGVRVGQTARLQIEGLPDGVGARVQRINPSAQVGSRSVLVYLQLQGQPGLRQGLFAQGVMGTDVREVLAVPLSSVRTDRSQPYVQVVDNAQVAHRTVQLGLRGSRVDQPLAETWVEVIGLDAGAQVLGGSLGGLRAGLAVQITQGR